MDMDEAIRELHELTDDGERGKRATEFIKKTDEWSLELARLRREVIDNLQRQGHSHAQIAAAIGVSRGRIGQLVKSGPAPERAFLGDGRLTIVVGQKPKPANTRGPVVAVETINARTRLDELAKTYQLESCHEIVPPPGIVDLNRNNLIVLSGPRLFPLVGQILDGDPNIRFETDPDGTWTLRDLNANKVHRASPRDDDGKPLNLSGPHRDFGYLGRIPRPDGRGSFLCIAGIHATGTQGVAAYIEKNLPHLYDEVKTRRFSMLIECEYDPENDNIVTTTTPASEIYRWS
jgi:hypothetical protein